MDFKLRTNARYVNNEDLLSDLKRVAGLLGKNTVTEREYKKQGRFSDGVYINRFRSWNQALRSAGLEVVRPGRLPEEELFNNLENVWLRLGRQPFYREMRKPLSKYEVTAYCRRFGSWYKACEAFIRSKEGGPGPSKLLKERSTFRSRVISEKLRLQVYKRDRYSCVICGRSPAAQQGVILHVDHIIPFSRGGDNSLENLRTLCDKCNLGRGNDADL